MDWAVDDIKELLTPVLGVMALLLTGNVLIPLPGMLRLFRAAMSWRRDLF